MKKDLAKPTLVAATALVGMNLLTGCASMNRDTAQANNGALSAVAFTSVTSPKDLVKWTGDRFIFQSMRSIDTYTFQVPDTGANAGNELTVNAPAVVPADNTAGGVGAGPGYETGSGTYKTIEYRPGFSSR